MPNGNDMKTKRTDLTREEIEAAEKAGISTLTPQESQELHWRQTSPVGGIISLDGFIILLLLGLVWWVTRGVFGGASKDEEKPDA